MVSEKVHKIGKEDGFGFGSENPTLLKGFSDSVSLETLQQGGVGLKFSSANDAEDKEVTVDIDPDFVWSPGSYYIEVSGPSSTFSLTVSTP